MNLVGGPAVSIPLFIPFEMCYDKSQTEVASKTKTSIRQAARSMTTHVKKWKYLHSLTIATSLTPSVVAATLHSSLWLVHS